MAGSYIDAVRGGLIGVLQLFLKLAMPLGIFLGLVAASWTVATALRGNSAPIDWSAFRKSAARVFGQIGIGLLVVALWSGLKAVQPAARDNIQWKKSAEATDNPAPEAPPIDQYGPVAATMVEKTYRRSITLPPDFLQRIGAEGVGVLSPYLVDPTAENVLKLADSFKRTGQDVEFTREVTREDEEPMSFDSSDIKVSIHRLAEQAYDADFTATYTFSSITSAPVKARFMFALPQGGGTVQDLKIRCGDQDVSEPDQRGAYIWTGQLNAGEKRQATVHYKSTGGRNWSYDLGSNRRRVKSFNLQATVDGPIQFTKGSIPPSTRSGNSMSWKLTDVVTSQQLSLSFPPDVRGRDAFLQALATLPATLVLFALTVLVAGWRLGTTLQPSQMAFGLVAFGLGLGATVVLANYTGPLPAVFIGPLAGAVLSGWTVGQKSMLATIPVALFPATSLSPQNTGLWVLVLVALAFAAYAFLPRLSRAIPKQK